MTNLKTVVVTGANRGIGLAICQQVLKHETSIKLYACSRAGKDLGLRTQDSNSKVVYPQLDVTNSKQIEDLVTQIKSDDGTIDVLINNAGTNKPGHTPEETDEVVQTNYYGTLNMCQAFLPLLSAEGRIVNLSSVGSLLHKYNKEIQSRFRDPNVSIAKIDTLANEYMKAVSSGNIDGWGDKKGYCFSKACVNAMTIALARDNPGLTINCCCPGWIDTDMGRIVGQPSKTPAEGTRIPLKLGFGNVAGVTGKYWSNPGVSDTADGRVTAW